MGNINSQRSTHFSASSRSQRFKNIEIQKMKPNYYLVIDVESIGLYGEAFAVAGVIMSCNKIIEEFLFACNPEVAKGTISNREWITKNVQLSYSDFNCSSTIQLRYLFWNKFIELKNKYPELIICGECIYPVEANFFAQCIKDDEQNREWEGPYPLHDISSMIFMTGVDPLQKVERIENELPEHNPLADARQSARLLMKSITEINCIGQQH